jgi:PST family polysaccharide transporter
MMLDKLNLAFQNISPNLRKILGNMSWLLAERILRMAIGFFVLAWTARYLGAAQFGLLNYAIAFYFIFSMIAPLGLNQIVLRDLVSEPSSKNEIIGTSFFLSLGSGIVNFLLATGIIFLLQPNEKMTCILVVIVSVGLIVQAFYAPGAWFESQLQSKYSVWASNAAVIIMALVRVVLIQIKAPLIAFAWAFLAEMVLIAIGYWVIYQVRGYKIQAWRMKWSRAKSMLKVSWPLIFSTLAIVLYLRIDQIMLGQLADEKAVGIYSVAVRLSELWGFIATAIVRSVAPSIIEAKKISENLYYEKIQKVCNLLVLVVYCLAIPMTFLSTPLIVLLFGQEYAPAGVVLSIHIWSSLFVFLGYAKEVWIATEELTVFTLVASTTGAVTNIILNFWLIPKYQAIGASIATVISYGIADYVMCLLYPKTRKFAWVMTKAAGLGFVNAIGRKA